MTLKTFPGIWLRLEMCGFGSPWVMVLIPGYMLKVTWEAFVLRLHPRPGESASSKMGCMQVVCSAPSDSEVYPGWRTGAIEQWFSSHWLHIRNTRGDFKKSKCLGPTPEQMSQNLWKGVWQLKGVCHNSFRWSGTPQVFRIIVIGNLVNERNLDLNPFLALWLCKPCMPVGWWVTSGRPSGLMEIATGWKGLKGPEGKVQVWVYYCKVCYVMWDKSQNLSGLEHLSTYLRFLPHLVFSDFLSSLIDVLLVFIWCWWSIYM